ncbi:MAG: NADPH-dependent glutamate synthase [Prevotellaceae bacterium]|jgi:glutamate synthase (NADPH/NADH) small chain|nr:NADPH-dependent glutamate synthase [Prevotellaceae bacterium]
MANKIPRVHAREQDAKIRITNFDEVCYGYSADEAILEASRCLNCKNPRCVNDCPVNIDIPEFISQIAKNNFVQAAGIVAQYSSLPAVCGRVCPQETQCEGSCILGIKNEPVAIGKLERFIADWARENNLNFLEKAQSNGKRIAVVGSGPAGLTCAYDLVKIGYDVTIFEALHETGGVLAYGIPEFRLPKKTVVAHEIENLKKTGVKIETNIIIGRTLRVDQLLDEEKFDAVFIGTGAGLPKFMNIKGENLNGVMSANEFLTRANLMKAFDQNYDTPIYAGKKAVVVGGGNVAMDAARTALRLGSEVTVVYRRTEVELPARREEVIHAKEEGINFSMLTNPVEIIENEKGWVKAIRCVRCKLGEPDSSGRRSPVIIPDSEFNIETDVVIMALGTSPNPLIASTTEGLQINKYKCIVVDSEGQTSRKGIFAGGDVATGAATVILAMGAGRKAANAIDKYLNQNK